MIATAALYKSSPSAEPQAAGVRLEVENRELIVVLKGQDIHRFLLTEITSVIPHKRGLDLVVGEVFLEIRDVNFCSHLSNILGLKHSYSGEKRVVSLLTNLPIITVLIVLGFLVWGFFWGVPMIAERSISFIPESVERDLGKHMFEQVKHEERLIDSTSRKLQHFLEVLDPRLAKEIRLHYAESNTVNAYAIPGGDIVVYSGLLQKMDKPEQLASLLSHEISHVKKRHSMKIMLQSISSYLVVLAVFGDGSSIIGALAGKLNELKNLSYSRDHETEADTEGFKLMKKWNLNPQGIVELFSILKKETQGVEPPALLNSHPATDERLQMAKEFDRSFDGKPASKQLTDAFNALKIKSHNSKNWD